MDLPDQLMRAAVAVSVLMPVRNGARWLDEAVASVLTQSWTDLELVVVDDASVDATPELLGAWCDRDPRVRVIRRAEATGAVAARREAVAEARGSLLAMLDSDDVAAPDRLARQVAEMAARPSLVLLGTGARYIDADGHVLRTERAATGRDVGVRLRDANLFFHPSVMVRADAFAAVGGYRSLLEPAEDYDLWLRLAEHGEVDNLPDALIDYRLHDEQVSFRQLQQQATAAAAAAWAAGRRATGAPDPLADLPALDDETLTAAGMPLVDLAASRCAAFTWSARMYALAGQPDLAAACWDLALREAALVGDDEVATVRRERGTGQ